MKDFVVAGLLCRPYGANISYDTPTRGLTPPSMLCRPYRAIAYNLSGLRHSLRNFAIRDILMTLKKLISYSSISFIKSLSVFRSLGLLHPYVTSSSYHSSIHLHVFSNHLLRIFMYDQRYSFSKNNQNNLLIRMICITFVKEYSG